MMSLNDQYIEACSNLLHGRRVGNTREISNYQFTIQNIDDNIINLSGRNLSLPYLLGELVWYFKGDNSVEFISKFGKMWSKLTDDGITNNSAYGYLIKHKHGFDQVEKIIELLKADPISRRAVININVPNKNVIETKDEPCTLALQFLIRNNKLNCTSIMRSNDIWFGLPYDVVFFTELQKYIARRLGLDYGSFTHFVVSLHLYDKDVESVVKIVSGQHKMPFPKLCIENLIDNVDEIYSKVLVSEDPKNDIIKICKEKGVL